MYIVDLANMTAVPLTERLEIKTSPITEGKFDLCHGEDVLAWGTLKYILRCLRKIIEAYENDAKVFRVDSVPREAENND